MNSLKIVADREDYAVGFTGTLNIDGFSGFGESWFNNSDVEEFSARLIHLATEMNGIAELVGSQSKEDGGNCLERFALRCYVLSESKLNGIIGVHVTLSEYPYTDCREQEILKVSGELKVRNHGMKEFAKKLCDLLLGSTSEITLAGDINE